jgi:small-conductance mechanosensitive channel/CRP-like cAMP-binding protein
MSPTVWSVGILVATAAGILCVRTLSPRVRLAFDVVCLVALSLVLYERGATPLLPSIGTPDRSAMWLRFIAVAWWLVTARVVVAILYFTLRHDRRRRADKLVADLTAAAIYVGTGFIVVKAVLALPVTGLVATSGVVAIVIGLALQSTLADVFAGIAVGIEGPFRVGDRVSLGDNIEGQIIETNWRSIRVQTDGDDIAIIPNSVVAKLEIVNRSVPSQRRAVSTELSCPTTSDADRVIEVLREATMLCPPILEKPAPSVALTRLGRNWNRYTISFHVADTSLVSGTKSLLLRHARKQLQYAGLLSRRHCKGAHVVARGPRSAMRPARQILRELTLFEPLQPSQIEDLARRLTTRVLEPGEILFAQGAADGRLYVVASGILELTRTTEGTSALTLGHLGAGEYIGEIGLLTGSPHGVTARARTHCLIYELSREAIESLISSYPDVATTLDKSARRGLDLLHRSVAASAAGNVSARGQLVHRIRHFFRSDVA